MDDRARKEEQRLQGWLDALQEPYKPLTKWEQGFVDSLQEQLFSQGWLSDRQKEVLERLYAQKTN